MHLHLLFSFQSLFSDAIVYVFKWLVDLETEKACYLQVCLNLKNQTDKELGPFEVWLSENYLVDEKAVMVNGLQKMVILFLFIP